MVLTKEELLTSLGREVGILLHLAAKVEPGMLDYRPTAKQRSMLELLQYLAMMGPTYSRLIAGDAFDLDAWLYRWRAEEAAAKAMDLEQARDAIGRQPAFFKELMNCYSDADLRVEIERFGSRASRGSWLVTMVLCHYAAYRMQLFLYLKACGREELDTVDLWVGPATRTG
jgi:hypothetical protein